MIIKINQKLKNIFVLKRNIFLYKYGLRLEALRKIRTKRKEMITKLGLYITDRLEVIAMRDKGLTRVKIAEEKKCMKLQCEAFMQKTKRLKVCHNILKG